MPGHVSSSAPAAYEVHHVVSDDLWVQIMTDDDPYFLAPTGAEGTLAVAAWHSRSRDGLFVHVETCKTMYEL